MHIMVKLNLVAPLEISHIGLKFYKDHLLKRSFVKRSAGKEINGQKDQWAKRSIVKESNVERSTVQKDQLKKRSIVERSIVTRPNVEKAKGQQDQLS